VSFGPLDWASALVQQPDGRLIVAGTSANNYLLLARYLPDGRVDTSFGPGGKVTTAVRGHATAAAMVLLPDGKLVVAGTTSAPCDRVCPPGDVLLARYLPDGGLDPFFGNQGLVITDFGGSETIRALVLQPNGSLVVAGQSSSQMLLARYFGDGRLDATFGVGGQVMASPGGSNLASALVRQPDGKLVVMGQTAGPIVLARYDADGTPDLAFGSGGSVQTMVGQASTASALTVAPDGDLVLVGYTQVGNTSNPLVDSLIVRYRPDGRLHPSFGSGGIVTTDFGGIDGARALVLQPDGKLVVAGFACVPDMVSPQCMTIARYQPNGSLDPSFGLGGWVTTFLGQFVMPTAVVLQPDGKLVVGGNFSSTILLARYQALGCPAVNPEPCLASLAAFVTEVYEVALARQPDAGEEAYWVDVLTTTPTPDIVRGMLHVVFESPEFRQRPLTPWEYVTALYRAMLGRDPDQLELDWWVQAVVERFDTLLPAFLASPEFQQLVPDCQDLGGVTLLVGRLYQHVLGRVASWEEIVWWTNDISTWCALEEAVAFFFNTLKYLGEPRTLDEHVTVLYGALLAREPDAGEQAWWVDDLAGQLADLEDEIMASPEFETRVYRLFP
jgi:uncharacterized delta-60 repeat protein